MGEDLGDDRDPLLVRPFVLPDDGRQEPAPSESTWPADQRAGQLPTQLLPTVPAALAGHAEPDEPAAQRRRHTAVLLGAGAVVMATMAGYALLRPTGQQDTWGSLPGQSLPAALGPATPTGAAPSPPPLDAEDGTGATGTGPKTGPTRPDRSVTPSGTSPASPASPAATSPAASVSSSTSVTPVVPAVPVVPIAPIAPAPTAIPTGSGSLVNGEGLCLDLRGGTASEGNEVRITDCSGSKSQRWQLNSDHTLDVLGMCAFLAGAGAVTLSGCDGRATGQWQLRTDGVLTNTSNGQCLTDPFRGARPGSAVVVTICTGGDNQRWSFR